MPKTTLDTLLQKRLTMTLSTAILSRLNVFWAVRITIYWCPKLSGTLWLAATICLPSAVECHRIAIHLTSSLWFAASGMDGCCELVNLDYPDIYRDCTITFLKLPSMASRTYLSISYLLLATPRSLQVSSALLHHMTFQSVTLTPYKIHLAR